MEKVPAPAWLIYLLLGIGVFLIFVGVVLPLWKKFRTYLLVVDYSLPRSKLMELGKYGYCQFVSESDIAKLGECANPVRIREKVRARPVCLDRVASSAEVRNHLHALGLKPANTHQLLTFGVKYPKAQRRSPIVSLDSRVKFDYLTLGVNEELQCRALYFSAPHVPGVGGHEWAEYTRFLAVPSDLSKLTKWMWFW